MSPQEIRELAVEIILDHARDVEFLTIVEALPEGLSAAEADQAAKQIDDLIGTADLTVELPEEEEAGDDL
jgi:hypothetical protein